MLKLTSLAVAATLSAGAAQAATLNFDDNFYSGGMIVSTFSKGGISGRIEVTGGAGVAMIYDTRVLTGGDDDLQAPFYKRFDPDHAPSNPRNVLIISEDGDTSDPDDNASGGQIKFIFDQIVDFDFFRVYDDVDNFVVRSNKGDVSTPVTLDFDNQWARVDTGFVGITELTFDFGTSSGAIDDLRVNLSTVPVPASLPLLLAGFGALGFVARRKAKKTA